ALSGTFSVRFALDGTESLGEGHVLLLGAGESTIVRSAEWLAQDGTHTVRAYADSGALVDELDAVVTEIEELEERLRFERDRLEKDEAVYTQGECDAELKVYGSEVHKVIGILRKTLKDLEELRVDYK
ncbi:MAG: hypothetical protein KY432_09290, partial [Acidobacteria bacterium]|nr:hypothetical protein [Acidobacteriota bacterium]